jgi:general secretion pathway protein G
MIELYWILAGTLVLSGIMLGVYRSLWQICGYSNTYLFGDPELPSKLGILPTAVIQTGLFVFLSLTLGLTSNLFKNQDIFSSISIATGFGLIFSLQLTVIRHIPENFRQFLLIGLSDTIIGAIAGRIFEGGPDIIEGGILGAIIGLFEILFRIKKIFPGVSDKDRADIFPFWIAAWIGGSIGVSFAAFASVIGALLAVMINYVLPSLAQFIGKFMSLPVSPMLILVRFKTILCNQCFRYTSPLRSRYRCGRRYCEHCQKQVEYTHDPGRLIVTFGDALPALKGRIFIFTNPDFELPDHPVEISEIYIDTRTCDKRLLEKCITSILHDPPKYGRRSVKVFYTGEFDNLGDNLRNALQNNFEHIEEFHPKTQRDLQSGIAERSQSIFLPIQKEAQTQLPEGKDAFENASFQQVSTQTTSPLSWRKVVGALVGGILGALLGGSSFVLLAFICAEMENLIVLESQVSSVTLGIVWVVLATLSGIRKGVQKLQDFAAWTIPLIFILVFVTSTISNLFTAVSKSRRSRTVADMRVMGTALGSYHVDHGFFPTSNGIKMRMTDEKEGIDKLLCDEGYYCEELQDRWKQPFIYVSDGTFYTLKSYGKDKKPGGNREFNSDIIYVNGRFTAPFAVSD